MRVLIFSAAVLISLTISAQKADYTYYFNSELGTSPEATSVLVGKGFLENGKVRLQVRNRFSDIKVFDATCTDSTLANFDGPFASYYDNGIPELKGAYKAGAEEGLWVKRSAVGLVADSIYYREGFVMKKISYKHFSNGKISSYSLYDSLSGTHTSTGFDMQGKVVRRSNSTNGEGSVEYYNEDGTVSKHAFDANSDIDAEYPGGLWGFRKHLEKTLDQNVPVRKKAPAGQYTVIVRFVIDSEGNIRDLEPETSIGFGMEAEVLRVIRLSGKWKPASAKGKPVLSYKRQPVTFVVAEE